MEEANHSSRFKIWSTYLAFNIIILISVSTIDVDDATKAPRAWSRGFSFLSALVTIPGVAVHFHPVYRGIILNTKNEFYMIATLLFLWTVLVAVVTSPTTGLAVEDDGAVALANLYYFTWAGFITGVVLLASYVESTYGISVTHSFQNRNNGRNDNHNNAENIKTPSMAFIFWSALMTSSLVVMGTSADIYNRNCEVDVEDKPQPFCSRTVFAIAAGVMGTISSLLVIIAKLLYLTVPFLGEVFLCALLFIIYGFELMYATAANGPAGPLGNLYYFSWISFFLCFGIGKCLYEDYVYAMEVAEIEYEEDNRRTTVPSLERHDVDEEEAVGGDDVVVVQSSDVPPVSNEESGAVTTNNEKAQQRRIDDDDDI